VRVVSVVSPLYFALFIKYLKGIELKIDKLFYSLVIQSKKMELQPIENPIVIHSHLLQRFMKHEKDYVNLKKKSVKPN